MKNNRLISLRFELVLVCLLFVTACIPAENVSTNPQTEILERPEMFQSEFLNPLDEPRTYAPDTCRAIRNKWNPINSKPGTVVMIILVNNVSRGTIEEPDSISLADLDFVMQQIKLQDFKAIDSRQLQSFLERNAFIPTRSVVIIQNGSQSMDYFDRNFRAYWDLWGWPVVNGWVGEANLPEELIRENVEMEYSGFVDHQARGVTPNVQLTDESSKIVIARELQGSITNFATNFGKNPTAIIWPNNGFGIRPVEAARQLRFKLGFTANPRGPVMYNWVPLADAVDPNRPNLPPEAGIGDPLMTLPAYPIDEALQAIDTVRNIGKAASEHAQQNKELEFNYYELMCEMEYGPIPVP